MGKYHIKKVKKLKFARFGGLSSVNQKGYETDMPDFHSPPASRGVYCFLWPYYEMFLLGAECTMRPYIIGAKFTYVRDNSGKIIDDKHPDWDKIVEKDQNRYWSTETKKYYEHRKNWPEYRDPEYDVKYKAILDGWEEKYSNLPKYVLVEKPKPRIFEYDGEIWHHLGKHLRSHQILETKGDWVKSSSYDYRDALDKEMRGAHKDMMQWCWKDASDKYRIVPTQKMALSRQSKDHLECFVEKL